MGGGRHEAEGAVGVGDDLRRSFCDHSRLFNIAADHIEDADVGTRGLVVVLVVAIVVVVLQGLFFEASGDQSWAPKLS